MQPQMNNSANIVPGVLQDLGKPTKLQTTAYWVVTAFLLLNLLTGGIADVVQPEAYVEIMILLGYPLYFMMILGVWKLLAIVTLLAPGYPLLKEWAYAGIFFNMTGAALSHAVSGSATWHILYPAFLAVLTLASWALRPPNRKLEAGYD